jgi:CheY-like chemotaxis protein
VGQTPLILIVDDSSDDVALLRRAFQKAGIANPMQSVDSGRKAIAYLTGEGEYADREKYPIPSIILLDLQMSDGDGFDVLLWIRNKFPQGGLLIVVLTRVEEIRKINRAYALGANSFLTKPGSAEELQELINIFHGYWIMRNCFPESKEAGSSVIKKGIWH